MHFARRCGSSESGTISALEVEGPLSGCIQPSRGRLSAAPRGDHGPRRSTRPTARHRARGRAAWNAGSGSRLRARDVSPDGEVVGVDLAPGMIALADAARIPNSRFEVMDIEQLSFVDASFDAAVCGH